MRSAWNLAQDVKFKAFEDNLYLMQFSCLGDWEKVMKGGPWVFRGKSVLIKEYDGYVKRSSIELHHLRIWIKIHDLPFAYRDMVKKLSGKVGKFVSAEPTTGDFTGNFYRVRVMIDVREPLQRVVSLIRQGKRELFLIKFEKLPDWCSFSGHLGHVYKEHGDGLHAPKDLKFVGLLADPTWRQGTRSDSARGRGRGRGGRGLGRGSVMDVDGDTYNNKADRDGLEDLDMSEAEKNRKRGVLSDNQSPVVNTVGGAQNSVGLLVNQFQQPIP
ncbi:hypothetical protein ACQ4PT_009513 [Festuca glaucescens]